MNRTAAARIVAGNWRLRRRLPRLTALAMTQTKSVYELIAHDDDTDDEVIIEEFDTPEEAAERCEMLNRGARCLGRGGRDVGGKLRSISYRVNHVEHDIFQDDPGNDFYDKGGED